jgi:hypothetical protein
MKTVFGTLRATLGIAILAAVFASLTLLSVTSSTANAQASPGSDPVMATPNPLVGFWYVNLTAEGNDGPPDGAVIDWGFQQFHSDGTEVLNSGSGPKKICFGVWGKETGPSTYKVNHFPIGYTPDGTAFVGPINLSEKFTLSQDHNSFTGTFTIDLYNPGGSVVVQSIVGRLGGKRVTVNTSVQDLLPMPPVPLAP